MRLDESLPGGLDHTCLWGQLGPAILCQCPFGIELEDSRDSYGYLRICTNLYS